MQTSGSSNLIIYKTSCSKFLGSILWYCITAGSGEVIHGLTCLLPGTSWRKVTLLYYSQRTALGKHVYGHMHRSPSVLLIDIEERVLQIRCWEWKAMVGELRHLHPDGGIFLFKNFVFPSTVQHKSQFYRSSWKHLLGGECATVYL